MVFGPGDDWLVTNSGTDASSRYVRLLGVRMTLVLAGTIGSVTTIGFLFLPGMRDADRQSDPLPEVDTSAEPPVHRKASAR